jgi:hypothetical protein
MFSFFSRPTLKRGDYTPIGRNLLKSVPFRDGRVRKELSAIAYSIGRRGGVPDRITEGEEITVPDFTLASTLTFDNGKVEVKRAIKLAVGKIEDSEIMACIDAAVPVKNTVTSASDGLIGAIPYAISRVEEHGLRVKNIVLHPRNKEEFITSVRNFKESSDRVYAKTSCIGKVGYANIYVSHRIPPDNIYFLADPDTVGFIMHKKKLTWSVGKTDPRKETDKYYCVGSEKLGIVVMADYAIGKIDLVRDIKGAETREGVLSESA